MPAETIFTILVGSSLTECMHTRKYFFLRKNEWRKAPKRELAIFDENRRAVRMLNEPYARQKMKARRVYRGGEGTTPVTTACPEEDGRG